MRRLAGLAARTIDWWGVVYVFATVIEAAEQVAVYRLRQREQHLSIDLILYKIHYYSLSRQTKHIRDVASALAYSGALLDLDYLERWARRLELTDVWHGVRVAAQRLLDEFE